MEFQRPTLPTLPTARGHKPVGGLCTTPAAPGRRHLFVQSVIRREVPYTQCDGRALKDRNATGKLVAYDAPRAGLRLNFNA